MYPAADVQLGYSHGGQYAQTVLPSGIAMMGTITFSGVPAQVTKLSLLEIRFSADFANRTRGAKFQLREVPVN